MVGFIAATLTTLATVPQVFKLIKTKNTTAISLEMYLLQVTGVFLWLVHGIIIRDAALIGANSITFVLTTIVLGYKLKYK